MIYSGSFLCGGSIVGKTYVITAAHCTFNRLPEKTRIKAGSSFLSSGGVFIQVESFANHPKYRRYQLNFDLAILILAEAIPTGVQEIQVISLPKSDQPIANNATARISGWGSVSADGEASEQLQYVDIPVVKRSVCRNLYHARGITITKQMICAGDLKSACYGDSGGPMVVNKVLFGVVSFGNGCGDPVYPGVYTSISNSVMRDWVTSIIGY